MDNENGAGGEERGGSQRELGGPRHDGVSRWRRPGVGRLVREGTIVAYQIGVIVELGVAVVEVN
jgi:hypothetical protein